MKKLVGLVFALLTATAYAAVPSQGDLLDGAQAFALSVHAIDAHTIQANWKIAPGYYLYRDKFKFSTATPGVTLEPANIPAGHKKHDEFFGDVETYRNQVTATIPVKVPAGVHDVDLKVVAQGCADLGVCYPPQVKTVHVALPVAQTTSADAAAQIFQGEQQFLDPDQAFALHVTSSGNVAHAVWRIAPGYYMYRDKIRFEVASPAGAKLGTYRLPHGQIEQDPTFGKLEIYHNQVSTAVPIENSGSEPVSLVVHYQGCAEKGICYPPITKKVSLNLSSAAAGTAADDTQDAGPAAGVSTLTPKTWVLAILAAFGTGLLLTFTPCVLPMVPILSSVIVGSATRRVTKLEGGLLSGAYVLGTAVTYTIAGVLAGASGEELQAYFQNIWAIGFLAIVFVALALSMFGLYELQVPAGLQSLLHKHSADIQFKTKHTKVGAYLGVFGMGLIAALIVGACVSPLVISALGVAVANHSPALGGAIMFAMALGMGVFLIAIGIGAGYLIPKAGAWMNTVKYVFGVLLLGVAIDLLGALPQVPVLFLWSAFLIIIAVYLGATQSLPKDANGWRYLWKGIGTFAFIWGLLALLGGLAGNRDVLHPITLGQVITASGGAAAPTAAADTQPLFHRVTTVAELQQQLDAAKAQGRPALVDFYADWCTDCRRMERVTFSDPAVRAAMQHFARIQADVTDTNDATLALKRRLNVLGPPAVVFFDKNGQEQAPMRFYGFKDSQDFRARLAQLS